MIFHRSAYFYVYHTSFPILQGAPEVSAPGEPRALLHSVGDRCRNQKNSTHHQDQSMERLATRERGVHLHTLEDRDAEALQERGWWSRTRSDSGRGRIRSKHRTTVPLRSTHMQPGDVSRALIQQGERERLGKTPSSSSTMAWW